MMADVVMRLVQIPGDDAEPQFEYTDDQSCSEGESKDKGSEDGGSDGEEAEDEEGVEGEEEDDSNANAGWAEAMAKILGKKMSESKSSILTKNKELDKRKAIERQEQLDRKKQIDKRQAWEMMCREKPDIVMDRETERALQRIATRGVVQLFNAVKKHQKNVDDKVKEVGGSDRKKAKILCSVSKKDFIDVLRGTEVGNGGTGKAEKNAAAAQDEKPAWSVLRDDFMMGASMKDWDKDSDKDDTGPHSAGGLEESDSD